LTQPVYAIKNLTHAYIQNRNVLEVDSLSIKKASITGLMGPNGSGKTTLLKLMAFIHKPSTGIILFNGTPAEPFAEHVRFRASLLPQDAYLMKRSVYSNIAYGLKIRGDKNNLTDKVSKALSMVGLGFDSFAKRSWVELSGGEAQRVAMAARLVLKPEVLLLDEPTAGVDAASTQLIRDAAMKAREEWGATLIIAGHDREWLYDICDNVLHMFRGRILEGKSDNILFGPWQKTENGTWEKHLQDGQKIIVNNLPENNAAAVIDSGAFSIHPSNHKTEPAKNLLNGTIARLMLEKDDAGIIAVIRVGNLTCNVKVTVEDLRAADLYPGKNVRLSFEPTSVKWIGSNS
jgi:tungstate transport system ATP-binding protein